MINFKNIKKNKRFLRANKNRLKIKKIKKYKLFIYKSNLNIYIYLKNPKQKILFSVSTLKYKNNKISKKDYSKKLGIKIAKKTKKYGIYNIIFDRSGYKYHGNIKNIAKFARIKRLKF